MHDGNVKVPAAVNELTQLGFLELSNNQIDSLPVFDRLERLEELYVNNNQLHEISVRRPFSPLPTGSFTIWFSTRRTDYHSGFRGVAACADAPGCLQ